MRNKVVLMRWWEMEEEEESWKGEEQELAEKGRVEGLDPT